MQNQNDLDTFVSDLIKAHGQMIDDELTHAKMLKEVNDRIDVALLSALPGGKLDAIEDAVKEGTITEDMVTQALESSDIDASAIITETLENFRNEYLNGEA